MRAHARMGACDMIKLIFVRHGESKSNESGKFAGSSDIPLSELGKKQAKLVCEYVLKNYTVDAVYASPLSRAYDTVKGIGLAAGVPVVKNSAFKEINGGLWEQKTLEEIESLYGADFAFWKKEVGLARPTGGETFGEVQTRALKGISELFEKHDGQTVAIGTHAGVIRALQCRFQGLPMTAMKYMPWVTNTSVTEVDFDGENFYLYKFCEDGHLAPIADQIKTKIKF